MAAVSRSSQSNSGCCRGSHENNNSGPEGPSDDAEPDLLPPEDLLPLMSIEGGDLLPLPPISIDGPSCGPSWGPSGGPSCEVDLLPLGMAALLPFGSASGLLS